MYDCDELVKIISDGNNCLTVGAFREKNDKRYNRNHLKLPVISVSTGKL